MEMMDKDTASLTLRKNKETSKFISISRGSPSSSASGEKPLPRYLRASTGSCHDLCKHGRRDESEEKPKPQLRRKLVKNLTMSDVNNQKSSLIPEEKKKKLSVNMKSSSLKSMEVSDKPKITRQKDSSGSLEAGTSKQIIGQELQISSTSMLESAAGDLALISASSNIEVFQVKSMDIGDRKKKPSLRQNSYLNRSASTEMPAMSLKVVKQKNPSLNNENSAHGKPSIPKEKANSSLQKATESFKAKLTKQTSLKSDIAQDATRNNENSAHGKPSIPKEKANSSLQKATESFKAKLTKQTSLKSDIVQDATRNPMQKTPVHPKVIHPSVQTSLKTTKKSAAKTEAQLSSSNSFSDRRTKGDVNIPSKSLGITKDKGLKVSSSSLSPEIAGHGKLRSKTKEDINGNLTSEENQVNGKGGQENDNIEEKKVCTIEMKPESNAVDHLQQGDEMAVNISPQMVTETLPVADILDNNIIEAEPVEMDNTKFHSIQQVLPEPGINDMVCLKQKGSDDQLFQKLSELEKVNMDFVQQIPNYDQVLEELVIPEDIGVGSLQQRQNDSQASEELQRSEGFTADTQYISESVESTHSDFRMENMTTSKSVNLPITQQELPAPESIDMEIGFSSQQLKSLAPENQGFDITKQEPSRSERITLEEVHSDQSYQVESHDEAEMDDIEEADSIYTESSEYESENDLSEQNGNVESSKTTEKRPRRTATVHPHDSSSAPHELKFRRGRIIEPQLESNSPRRLRFRQPKVGANENDNQKRRNSFWKAEIKDTVSENPDAEAKSVVLRPQGIQEKKDTQGLYNNVIEETASKLVETRKSKVKALVGAFETVMSLQDSNSASTS